MGRTSWKVHAVFARAVRIVVMAAILAVVVPVGVPAASAANVTYWVDINTGVDDGAHGSEALPFKTITYAVTVADAADFIRVKPGTYSSANGETLPIVLSGETLLSTAGSATTTILGNGSQQLLVINGWTDRDYLTGFTFENGGTGGSAAVLVNLQTAVADAARPYIAWNTFSNNDNGTGGALVISSPTAGVATSVLVQGNTFSDNVAAGGGALKYDGRGAVHIIGNTFVTNTANSGGAVALFTYDALCTVSENSFIQNSATGGGGQSGGALYWEGHGSSLRHTVDFNEFSNNTAANAGGAIYFSHTKALVDSNFGSYNSSPFGGFAYLEQGIITAENNYFTGHSASVFGAVWNLDNTSHLDERNDTLWAQAAGPQAARLADGGTGAMNITNCIYWNPNCGWEMERATVSYTCSSNDAGDLSTSLNTVGAGMVYAHPQVNTLLGVGKLDPTSPCIDVANPANSPTDDYYETARPQDGDGDRVDEPDIGCYEAPDVTPSFTPAPVYRFYNFTNNTHFFTDSEAERDHVIATWPNVFSYEGEAYFTNPSNNTTPLTRLYNKVARSHFYTASAGEAANALATWPMVFSLDGPTYAVNPGPVPFSIPVYRFYNMRNGSHFYTASETEKNDVIAKYPTVYRLEGPAFWIGQ